MRPTQDVVKTRWDTPTFTNTTMMRRAGPSRSVRGHQQVRQRHSSRATTGSGDDISSSVRGCECAQAFCCPSLKRFWSFLNGTASLELRDTYLRAF